jgi:uncharacterized protein (TIGR03435 family)
MFEVASVKPSNPAGGPFARTMGGPGTTDPGRIRYSNMPLKVVLLIAYGLNDFQIEGPGWMETDRFEIEATMPVDTTRERFREMLRNLMVERFKIALHREKKDAPAYTLVVDKNGPRMAESTPAAAPPDGGAPPRAVPPQQLERDRDGFPKLPSGGPPGMLQFAVLNRARLAGRLQTMSDLANRLAELLGYPVADGTGLTAKYDLSLTFATEGTALSRAAGPPVPPPPGGNTPSVAEGETPPDLFSALQTQLGLKLEARRASLEVIVIDRIARTPAAN